MDSLVELPILYPFFIFLLQGYQILTLEKRLGLPVPISPGAIFWLGHFLSFFLGGALAFGYGYQPFKPWAFSLWLVVIAFFAFNLPFLMAGLLEKKRKTFDVFGFSSQLPWKKINRFTLIGIFFLLGVIFVPKEWLLGFLFEGLSRRLDLVFLLFLGISFFAVGVRFYSKILFFGVFILYNFYATITGGREALLFGLFVLGLFGGYWLWKKVGIFFSSAVILLIIFTGLIFFQLAREYRGQEVNGEPARTADISVEERAKLFQKVVMDAELSDRLHHGLGFLGKRVYEYQPANFVFKARKRETKSYLENLTKEFVFQYIPKLYWPSKGELRNKYLLRKLGAIGERRNVPFPVVLDSYFRFGFAGLLPLFFALGFVWIFLSTRFLFQRKTEFWVLYCFFVVSSLRLYVTDSLGLILFFTYDLLVTMIGVWVLVKMASLKILPKSA